jgi:hypothetical protein
MENFREVIDINSIPYSYFLNKSFGVFIAV